jgi:cytochrome P450
VKKHYGPYEVFLANIIKPGLVTAEGQEWRNRKKVLSKVFNYEFIVSQIPEMVAIADRTFADFEEAYWKEHSEHRGHQLTVQFFELMVKYTSSVVMSGFLGIDSLKEMLHNVPIVEAIL